MADSTKAAITWSEEELRAKIGQLFIVGFHGYTPSKDIKHLIETHKVGAIILFQRNVRDAAQLSSLTKSLQEIARKSGHKQDLFIGIDQENGLVTRIKEPVAAQLPGPMALAATGDSGNAYKIALATAETLKTFGINFNYAPIADVNSEPKNPVIGVRSPSDDPETVGRFVSAQVKGFQEGGVVPCVKHFPGHGDTAVDSHFDLPVINKTKSELDACELVPFRRAVVEGVDAVMTAHIALPKLGHSELADDHSLKKVPASLNADVMAILREELKYDGLVVSDCLEMDGVRATFGTERGAVLALKTGTDCVMICHTADVQIGAIESVVEAVKSGELTQASIERSFKRVEKLKTKYLATAATFDANKWEQILTTQATLAADVYSQSTTVVRSDPDVFPASNSSKIVFISSTEVYGGGGVVESGEEGSDLNQPSVYLDLLQEQVSDVTGVQFAKNKPLSAEAEQSISEATAVILATQNANLCPHQKEFGLPLGKKLGKKFIVIATCDPYDFLEEQETIKNYVTIYEPTVPAFRSALNVIFGKNKAVGKLPIGKRPDLEGIRSFTGSEEDTKQIWELWQGIFPTWPIEYQRLAKIFQFRPGKHLIHEGGFCIAFNYDGMGKIVAVGVLPDFRGKGLGTALVNRAHAELKADGNLTSFGVGSSFPRFWAGLPIDTPQEYKDFFLHRGFRLSTEPTARDLFRNITVDVAPSAVVEKVSKLPLKFAPWSAEGEQECLEKQRANFGYNIAWVKAYEEIAAAGQHHEVMVAFDAESGAQVGWTLMCSPQFLLCDMFAFLPLTPRKDKTGLIACVGVEKSQRGKGTGLALLVKAMENMRERGMEGVLIDWVVIRGFYENLGFDPIWEYEGYDW